MCAKANLSDQCHCEHIIQLLNTYATDIMGGGEEISDYTRQNLCKELRSRSSAHVFLAFSGAEPVGLAITFEGQ